MDVEEFRKFGKATVDYLANYFETIRERPVLPRVEPGYLQNLLPREAPTYSEKWEDIMEDMDKVIMPGVSFVVQLGDRGTHTHSQPTTQLSTFFQVTHWQSPKFHAYFPTSCSYPGIVGELLSAGLGIVGFNWMASPACTELEVITLNWLGKLLGIPKTFLGSHDGPGGGVIQGSASESTFVCLLAAKHRKLRKILEEHPDLDEAFIKGKMVAYASDQSNSSVEKAGILGSMPMRLLKTDGKGSVRGEVVLEAIKQDMDKGLIPTYVRITIMASFNLNNFLLVSPNSSTQTVLQFCATLGTTVTCGFDNLEEIGPICRAHDIWMHVDAAYAGAAFICPEFRYIMAGVELADSFNFNPHKWLLVNFDCSALWVKDANWLTDAFKVERVYLKHKKEGVSCAPDYRDWQVPLGRRFRSLKLWITLRSYGQTGLQNHIRQQIGLAKEFNDLVKQDSRFEVPVEAVMGLVCFRLKGINDLTICMQDKLMVRGNIYTIAGTFQGVFFIRFVICSQSTTSDDVVYSWKEIQHVATQVLREHQIDKQTEN
ncbi:hypothetical protein RUM44_003305 [Polyplax serrata]|uniref:Aromatic-L-amino-acid decarboxylase n=1 Tax=Polyplax serrata TaxID=468196 RepID=A0ABR1AHF3_POLSC